MAKHLKLSVFFLLCLPIVHAQTNDIVINSPKAQSYEWFMQKKRNNNTAGWIMVGAGSAMVLGGFAINVSGGVIDNDTTNNSKGLWLSYLGGATTIASVPFFISAGKNKRRAKLALNQEVLSAPFHTFKPHQIALSLNIDLN